MWQRQRNIDAAVKRDQQRQAVADAQWERIFDENARQFDKSLSVGRPMASQINAQVAAAAAEAEEGTFNPANYPNLPPELAGAYDRRSRQVGIELDRTARVGKGAANLANTRRNLEVEKANRQRSLDEVPWYTRANPFMMGYRALFRDPYQIEEERISEIDRQLNAMPRVPADVLEETTELADPVRGLRVPSYRRDIRTSGAPAAAAAPTSVPAPTRVPPGTNGAFYGIPGGPDQLDVQSAPAPSAAAPAMSPAPAGTVRIQSSNGTVYRVPAANVRAFLDRDPGAYQLQADGGPVRGSGSTTSDNVTIKVSPGEYVLPAESMEIPGVPEMAERARMAGLALREGRRYANGGRVRYRYASGGSVGGGGGMNWIGLLMDLLKGGNQEPEQHRIYNYPGVRL